jgi:ABC-2 type transport system permease protein
MNSQSETIRESFDLQTSAPAPMAKTRPFYWSVRRELWESRWIYLAPLGVAAVFLFGFLITLVHFPAEMRSLSTADPTHYRDAIVQPYDIVAGLMMAMAIIMTVFYCSEALYSERRDRSILFWKSLPVSDLTTVLAKASIPFIVVPLVTSAVAIVTQFIMLLASSAVLLGGGLGVASFWATLAVPRMWWLLFYHIATHHIIWPAPIYCWLLLVSAWAPRAPFFWAVLPPFAVAGLERITFHTWYFGNLLWGRFIGDTSTASVEQHTELFPTNPMLHTTPATFLSSAGLWIGLLIAAAFIVAAIQLRRRRGPI